MFRLRRLPLPLLALFPICAAVPARADVVPPLVARIEVIKELPEGNFEARVSVFVPRTGSNTEAKMKVTVISDGIAQLSGRTQWILESVEPGKEQELRFLVKLKGYGDGSVTVHAESFDEKGGPLWGRADSLFVLNTPEDRLRGKSNEARYDFRPEVWKSHRDGQSLAQRWFGGVHSNVGGGYVADGLANVAFHWILDEATQRGLKVDRGFAAAYRRYPQDRLYRSESLLYRFLDGLHMRFGRGHRNLVGWPATANLSLSPSVIHRIQAEPAERDKQGDLRFPELRRRYRPPNVLLFLACQPDLDRYLEDLGLDEQDRRLPQDVMRRIAELRKDC